MRHFCLYVLACLFVISCQNNYDKNAKALHFIPKNSNLVLKINSYNEFKNGLETNPILNLLYNNDAINAIKVADSIVTSAPLYISFLDNKMNQSCFLVVTELMRNSLSVDSLNLRPSYITTEIRKHKIDTLHYFIKTQNNVLMASNDSILLKNLELNKSENLISSLFETTNKSSLVSIVAKKDYSNSFKLLFDKNISQGYLAVDLDFNNEKLLYNGVLINKDTTTDVATTYKSLIPQRINSTKIAPDYTKTLKSITYNDYSILKSNLYSENLETTDSANSFINYCSEISIVDNALILYSLDTELLFESIDSKSFEETFREIDIYNFDNSDYFKKNIEPLLRFENASYFFSKDNFTVFSDNIDNLKKIISQYLSNNTLHNSEAFQNIKDNLSDESSLLIYKNAEGLSEYLNADLSDYDANVVQYIREVSYTHVNGVLQKYKKRKASNTISEYFSATLNNDIIVGPQAVTNHLNNTKEIIAQDSNNILYLISNTGNILWTKKLQDKILGNVEQIDIYKNGRLQLAFATSKRVYVLDRNGNDVGPFPLKFKDQITQPLSVFDYDKKRNYRLLVTQGKNLLMYNTKAKLVTGFNYNDNKGTITTQPKHFRVGSKDYIVFGAGERLQILNRRGAIRIKVNEKIRFSGNEIYLHQNKFTTTNSLGQLVQVNVKGNLNTKQLNLTEKHSVDATSKTLVTLNENKLKIRSKTLDLDYGDYTNPEIFYLNDKIYVTVTDLQAKKVYLFDSQAKQIPNFPIYGTSEAILTKLDGDKNLELITTSDSKTILSYKLY